MRRQRRGKEGRRQGGGAGRHDAGKYIIISVGRGRKSNLVVSLSRPN